MIEQTIQALVEELQELRNDVRRLSSILDGARIDTRPQPEEPGAPAPMQPQPAPQGQPAPAPQPAPQGGEQQQQPAATDPWANQGQAVPSWPAPAQEAPPPQPAPAQEAPPPQPAPAQEAPPPQPAPAPQPAPQGGEQQDSNGMTLGHVRDVLAQLERQTALDLLTRYGVSSLQELKADHYTPVVQEAANLLNGGAPWSTMAG